ncbi:MAG: ribosomal protein [Deltaproteobacteria bacterium]|nr:ribosomal protein [Deltaproteobacteria bacterium]
MAQRHQSAIKRHRQSVKRHARNQMIRTRVRHTIRDLREIIENQDLAAAETKLRSVMTTVEKAVTKGVLQRNTASRYISRLSHQVAALRAS